MPLIEVFFKKTDDKAIIPSYAHPEDAGMDVHSIEAFTLRPGEQRTTKIGLIPIMRLHNRYTGKAEIQCRPRSGLAHKYGVTVTNSPGTIDSNYRGEIGVILKNLGDKDFHVSVGDRIAQLVVAELPEVCTGEWLEKDVYDTDRGGGGFGSTGR